MEPADTPGRALPDWDTAVVEELHYGFVVLAGRAFPKTLLVGKMERGTVVHALDVDASSWTWHSGDVVATYRPQENSSPDATAVVVKSCDAVDEGDSASQKRRDILVGTGFFEASVATKESLFYGARLVAVPANDGSLVTLRDRGASPSEWLYVWESVARLAVRCLDGGMRLSDVSLDTFAIALSPTGAAPTITPRFASALAPLSGARAAATFGRSALANDGVAFAWSLAACIFESQFVPVPEMRSAWWEHMKAGDGEGAWRRARAELEAVPMDRTLKGVALRLADMCAGPSDSQASTVVTGIYDMLRRRRMSSERHAVALVQADATASRDGIFAFVSWANDGVMPLKTFRMGLNAEVDWTFFQEVALADDQAFNRMVAGSTANMNMRHVEDVPALGDTRWTLLDMLDDAVADNHKTSRGA